MFTLLIFAPKCASLHQKLHGIYQAINKPEHSKFTGLKIVVRTGGLEPPRPYGQRIFIPTTTFAAQTMRVPA